jgi:hypothetical protein
VDTRGAEASGQYYYPYKEEQEWSEEVPLAGLCRAGKKHLSSHTCDTGAGQLSTLVDYSRLIMIIVIVIITIIVELDNWELSSVKF